MSRCNLPIELIILTLERFLSLCDAHTDQKRPHKKTNKLRFLVLHKSKLDAQALNVVYKELNATLQSVFKSLELFSDNTKLTDTLNTCDRELSQVIGILKLIRLPCAETLAEHSQKIVQQFASNSNQNPFALKALGHSLVGLTCYLEYVKDTGKACPPLIESFVNECRAALRLPIQLESTTSGFTFDASKLNAQGSVSQQQSSYHDLFKRMRSLYQVGLLGLLQEESTEPKLQLLFQTTKRLADQTASLPNHGIWAMAAAVFESLIQQELSLSFTRKRLLAQLDSALRLAIQTDDISNLQYPERLVTELAYLISKTEMGSPLSRQVVQKYQIKPSRPSDSFIQSQRQIMQGPDNATVNQLISEILQDVQQIKSQLESVADGLVGSIDYGAIKNQLVQIENVLMFIGASQIKSIIEALIKDISGIEGEASKDTLSRIAENLLHAESMISHLNRLNLTDEDNLGNLDFDQHFLSKNQLQLAQQQLIAESIESLASARNAFNSFLESNYRKELLEEIIMHTESVKGAIDMLGHSRASNNLSTALNTLLELNNKATIDDRQSQHYQAIADVLIGLEYYLNEIQQGENAPISVLAITEESFANLPAV